MPRCCAGIPNPTNPDGFKVYVEVDIDDQAKGQEIVREVVREISRKLADAESFEEFVLQGPPLTRATLEPPKQ